MAKVGDVLTPGVERLIAADRMAEAGREVGRGIQTFAGRSQQQPRRGNRRTGGLWRKASDWIPTSPEEFVKGGMLKLEYIAGERARDAAIRSEREYWLPQLEQWHAAADDGWIASILKREIKRLRRALGIKRTPELVREQARRRVQALSRTAPAACRGRISKRPPGGGPSPIWPCL